MPHASLCHTDPIPVARMQGRLTAAIRATSQIAVDWCGQPWANPSLAIFPVSGKFSVNVGSLASRIIQNQSESAGRPYPARRGFPFNQQRSHQGRNGPSCAHLSMKAEVPLSCNVYATRAKSSALEIRNRPAMDDEQATRIEALLHLEKTPVVRATIKPTLVVHACPGSSRMILPRLVPTVHAGLQ